MQTPSLPLWRFTYGLHAVSGRMEAAMKYTFRRIAGILCIVLATVLLSRFMPMVMWYIVVVLLAAAIIYFLYVCFYK